MGQKKRLDELKKVPHLAALDHRLFLDKHGKHRLISELPRNERRRLEAEGAKIFAKYRQIVDAFRHNGVGYPVDQLLRQLALEYTHRYASSGLMNQPASFNYFEPFCSINLIGGSFAPYAKPVDEENHLFSVPDFIDYLTSDTGGHFSLSEMYSLPDGTAQHFTQNGSIFDFTYMTSDSREFLVSGFSMVRRGNSLHWYMLGGETLSEEEWKSKCEEINRIEIGEIPPHKRPFLSEHVKDSGNKVGPPVALEGTKTALRTIISGEVDLLSAKHVSRCYMSEREDSFLLFCDDPEVFRCMQNPGRDEFVKQMSERVEEAAVMWNLAEGFFQLPSYFKYRLTVSPDILNGGGKHKPKVAKGGAGIGTQFKYVTAIEVSDTHLWVMRSYTAPHFEVETDGYWHRLKPDGQGVDREGHPIRGKTWMKAHKNWYERPDRPRTVYIKSTVAAAKVQISNYLDAARKVKGSSKVSLDHAGVLYVMRCSAMKEEVYKVGWTSNNAAQRARELSAATGVAESFVVIKYWKHKYPEALERGVHAMLSPYRLNQGREFFQIKLADLEAIIEQEIGRSKTHSD